MKTKATKHSSTRARPQERSEQSGSGFWLLFNVCGEISFCSQSLAQLLDRDAASLQGLAVTSVLHQLPLKRETPGDNIATMTMDYVGREWPLELTVAPGRRLPVVAWVRPYRLGTGPAFVVELGPRGQRNAPRADP